MIYLEFWDRIAIISGCAAFLLLVLVCMLCKICECCWCYKNCPIKARYDKSKDLDNEYSDDPYGVRGPIPKTGSKVPIQDLHPEFWSKNLHSDASPYTSDREMDGYSSLEDEGYDMKKMNGAMVVTTRRRGALTYSIVYKEMEEKLTVQLYSAASLPLRYRHSGGSGVFVRLCLQKNEEPKQPPSLLRPAPAAQEAEAKCILQSKTHKKTENPHFEETFEIFLSKRELQVYNKLNLLVCEHDKYSRQDVIGQLNISLNELDLSKEKRTEQNLNEPEREDSGELLVSLSFLPTSEKLSVVVMKVQDLKPRDHVPKDKEKEVYVKATMVYNAKRKEKKKTSNLTSEKVMTFNETLAFDIPEGKLPKVLLVLTVVWVYMAGRRKTVRHATAGTVHLGHGLAGSGNEHWIEMAQSPRKQIAKWHTLK